MLRLARYSCFTTDDADEFKESSARLLDRRIDLLVEDSLFHFAVHTARMELLTVSAIELTEGLTVRVTNTEYTLARVETGGIERHSPGHDYIVSPGIGHVVTPGQQATTVLPYSVGIVASVSISLPASLIQREAEYLAGEPVEQPLIITGPLHLGPYTHLGQMIDSILDELDRDDGVFERYPLEGQRRQRALIDALIERTRNNYQPLLQHHHGGPARRHIARMQEFIAAHLCDPLTVGDLAHVAGVSIRTLRKHCHDVLGVRPEDEVLKMRLHAVRKRLENPQPGDSITTVAHQYGFTNIKRFADHYRREFHGETAVDTFHRAHKRLLISLGAALGKPPAA